MNYLAQKLSPDLKLEILIMQTIITSVKTLFLEIINLEAQENICMTIRPFVKFVDMCYLF